MNFQVEKTKLNSSTLGPFYSVPVSSLTVTEHFYNAALFVLYLGRLQNRFTLKTLFSGHLDLLRVTKPNKD